MEIDWRIMLGKKNKMNCMFAKISTSLTFAVTSLLVIHNFNLLMSVFRALRWICFSKQLE